jgi:FixJ family two-component response regulator
MPCTDEPLSDRVLVLEPNATLRSAIVTVLTAEHYSVEAHASLEQVVAAADGNHDAVCLIAWQSMRGLLAEEHRRELVDLASRVRLVVMVPRAWARLLESTEVTRILAGLVAKPFEADELLNVLSKALATPMGGDSRSLLKRPA